MIDIHFPSLRRGPLPANDESAPSGTAPCASSYAVKRQRGTGRRFAYYFRSATGDVNAILRQRAAALDHLAKTGDLEDLLTAVPFGDIGASGMVMARPGLQSLLRAVRDGEVHTVFVEDPDRLSRDRLHLLVMARSFEESNVVLVDGRGPVPLGPSALLIAGNRSRPARKAGSET